MRRNKKSNISCLEKNKTVIKYTCFTILLVFVWYGIIQFPSSKKVIKIETSTESRQKINYQDDDKIFKNPIFKEKKIVHLDLKGAPPKIEYLEQLFPLLSKLGANGLLIEYEDIFPYSGILSNISNLNSFSKEDIKIINKIAQSSNLTIIPIIQTIGQLEFILKLKKFKSFRAYPEYPDVICINSQKSLEIIFEMIDQMIELHPGIQIVHLGTSEVQYIGKCESDLENNSNKFSKNQLLLQHITEVVSHIHRKYANLRILINDNLFRNMSPTDLKSNEIIRLIEPVVRGYSADVYNDLGPSLWYMYRDVFQKIWISSAFKGTTGNSKYLTEVSHHLENQRSWLFIVSELEEKINFEGIILSGKQRYDHFSVLCELLPVSIPSLALCLRILQGYNDSPLSPPIEVSKILQCDQPYGLLGPAFGTPRCSYPGADILEHILRFHQIKQEFESIIEHDKYKGWLNEYNVKFSFSNNKIIGTIFAHLKRLAVDLEETDEEISTSLSKVYNEDTVKEWRISFLEPLKNQIGNILKKKQQMLSHDEWPRRPLIH